MMQICAAKQSLYLRPQKQRILHPEIRFTLSGDFKSLVPGGKNTQDTSGEVSLQHEIYVVSFLRF